MSASMKARAMSTAERGPRGAGPPPITLVPPPAPDCTMNTPAPPPAVIGWAMPASIAGLPGAVPGEERLGEPGGVRRGAPGGVNDAGAGEARPPGLGIPNVATPAGAAWRVACGTAV